MKFGRFTPNSGEIFHGEKPELIGPTVDIDKVLEIMIGQLQVLKMMTQPAIYIPTEKATEADQPTTKEGK